MLMSDYLQIENSGSIGISHWGLLLGIIVLKASCGQ